MTPTPSPPPAALTLHLHGSARARAADGRQLQLRGRAAALVAMVALEGDVSRERAAQLLWPDSPNPRQTLRQQLLRFRQALGQPLLQGEQTLTLADLVHLVPAAAGALLLADEDDNDDRFGAWLTQQRRSQRQQQLGPLRDALQQAESSGDLTAALEHAQTLLQHEPSDESHHAALMRVHYLRGEPSAGLAVYERLAARLQAELGASPAAATRELAQALRRSGNVQAASAADRPTSTALSAAWPVVLKRPPLMAGRRAELAAVQRAWAEGHAVLVEGEAGMGKSRLLAESLAALGPAPPSAAPAVAPAAAPGTAPLDTPTAAHPAAPAAGTPALHATARPGDSGAPYSALARLLQPLLALSGVALSADAQDALSRIGTRADADKGTDPGSRIDSGPGDTSGQPARSSASRTAPLPLVPGALQAAVAELLDRAHVHTVVLDDLHFSDDATLELISGLATSESPRRWLLAQRPAEQTVAARALRQGLTELQRLTVVTLQPLDAQAAAELVDSLAVAGLQGPDVARALVRHTGGNPLFLLETLKQGLQDGSLARGELPRPASVGALIEQRLQRLSEPALTLARVAAMAGVDFSIELAEAAIGQSAVQLASAWRELQDAQVLRDEALTHDLVADALTRGVPPVVARRVHAAVAAWLQKQSAPAARVAAHLWQAGQEGAAALQALAAARLSSAQGRAQETLALLDQALAVARWPDPGARFEAARMRCEALWDLDLGARLDEATTALKAAAETPHQRATAAFTHLNGLYYRGDFATTLAAAAETTALAEQAKARDLQLQVCTTHARALARTGAVAQGLALLRAAQPLLQGLDEVLHFEFHGVLGTLLIQAARVLEARIELQRAIDLAPRVARSVDLPNLISNLATCDHLLGQAEIALAGHQEVLHRASLSGNQGLSVQFTEMNIASALLDLNRYAEAWDWITRCEEALARHAPTYAPMSGTLRARWYLELGQPTRAAQVFAGQPLPADAPPYVQAYRALVQAQVAAAGQQVSAAQAVQSSLRLALQAARTSGRPNLLWEVQLMAHSLGCPEGAGELEQIAAAAQDLGMAAHAGVAHALRGNAQAAAPFFVDRGGLSPRWFYRGRVLAALCDARLSDLWLQQTAQLKVPAEFRESFLHRQPVNLRLRQTPARSD